MELVLLLSLVLFNGLFAMAEIALVTARKARLQALADSGDGGAAAAMRLGEDPTRFLSTVQIGITAIGVGNGILGESLLAGPLAAWLVSLGLGEVVSARLATGLVVVVITYVSIVLGELVPKRLGQSHPEFFARMLSRPLGALAVLSRPFVNLLTWSTKGVLRLLGHRETGPAQVTEEELHAMLRDGTSAGIIELHEHAMVRNVFRLDERRLGSLMVPRADVVVLDLELGLEANLARVQACRHTRFPVVRGGFEDCLGLLNARQWMVNIVQGGARELEAQALQQPLVVPESLTGLEVLEQLRNCAVNMAFVVDEYGEVQGIVTMQDLVEAIVGEMTTCETETPWAVQREDGSWLLDGHIPIPELKDRLGLKAVPDEQRGRYHTLSGMLMLLTGRVPKAADVVSWEGWRLEVVDMDGHTIDKVLATRVPQPLDTAMSTG